MNDLEAKCYLTKQAGANNSDHDCISAIDAKALYEIKSFLVNLMLNQHSKFFNFL